MKKTLLCLILLAAAFNVTFGQVKKKPVKIIGSTVGLGSAAEVPKLSPDLERRYKTFQLVWSTIKENYFDQTFSGLDWEKIRQEYEPQVLKTESDNQLYAILNLMINRLNRSHFAIIPPEVSRELEKARLDFKKNEKSSTEAGDDEDSSEDSQEIGEAEAETDDWQTYQYGIGVELRLINNQFVITNVAGGSSAEKAGLKPGFVIEKINQVSLMEFLERLQNWKQASESLKKKLPLGVVSWYLNGEEDTLVSITYQDEKEQSKQIDIKREKLGGKMVQIGDEFPAQFFSFESKSLNSDVGYIKFNLFALPTIEYFCASLTELKDKKAIIIDLRGNIGGVIGSVIGVSGMLTDKSIDLGTQIYKIGSEKLSVSPKAKNYRGKLVFLTDSMSVSSAEMFAAAMQENNRALVVGEKSAGEALPSFTILLPTGARMLYPVANFKTPKGNFLEGKGVVPDFTVSLDKKSLLEGKDNQLEAALKIISEDKAFPKQIEKPGFVITDKGGDEPKLAKPVPTPVKGKILGNVQVIAPKMKGDTKPEKLEKDAKSLQVINDFINAVGGAESLRKIDSYQISGAGEYSIRGSKFEAEISIYRQKFAKYAYIMKLQSIGEIREVYTDKNSFLQTDFGESKDSDVISDISKIEILAPINSLLEKDNFKSLKYLGEFEREGRMEHLIEAKNSDFYPVTLAFDSQTKMLVGYASPVSTEYLGDYRKVGDVMLPFEIIQNVRMKISVGEFKLNQKIDESIFTKKENCFDRAN